MGMLVEGLNKIRDFWSSLTTGGQLGTGTNTETAQDTTLQTAVSTSDTSVVTTTTTDQQVKKFIAFPSTSAGDEEVTELVWKNATSGLAGSRITFDATTWSADSDLEVTTKWYIRGKNG